MFCKFKPATVVYWILCGVIVFGFLSGCRNPEQFKAEADKDDTALKWLALASLHGINNHAEKIIVTQSNNGETEVAVEYYKCYLPSPGSGLEEKIIKTMRDIIHIEGDKGKSMLALGVKDSSLTLEVKIKAKKEGEKLVIKFPK